MADLSGVKLHYVDSVDKAADLMRWLGERHPTETLGVDIETGELPGNPKEDALSPWHGRIRLAQIGDGYTGWAVPWERWGGVFEEAFTKFEGSFLIHNSAFDTRWLELHSDLTMPWHRLHDSMIASRIVSPTESAALKRLTAKYVDPRASALQQLLDDKMRDGGWTWGTVPLKLQEYWSYGALDTVLAVRMWEKMGVDVLPGGKYADVYDLEMATRRICTRMEMNGARIDVDYSKQKYSELVDSAEGIKKWAAEHYDGVNIASTPQLVKLFEGKLGARIVEKTDAGNPRVDKIQLQRFRRDYAGGEVAQLADAILASRKAEKLASSYFKNFLDRHTDGVLHPSINTLAARTSRMSIQDPALQTLPKKDKIVRKAFLPRTEDEIIMSCDLEQVEARVFSCLSGDTGLIDMFNFCDSTGEDFFTQIGREVYSEPDMQKADARRQLLKNMMYGRLYGAGNDKMALTAGVQPEQMKAVNNSFDARFPGMKNLMRTIEDLGSRRFRDEGEAYVMTGSGRRLPADEGKVYTLVNYLIQGTSAEILKLNILKCDAMGLTDYMIVPVHDELVLSVPRTEQEEVGKVLQECMTTRTGWTVPLLAGAAETGERWGDLGD
jgi:DNA polymerase-1